MKKIVATIGIVLMLVGMSVQTHQIAADGSFQVTFKNGYNVSYDTQTKQWMNFSR